jgi:hypothetical protein
MAESSSETKKIAARKDGAVLVTVDSDVTEQDITEERETIVLRLHGAYLNLSDYMGEFQQQWDENPTLAFLTSAREGWNAGGAQWLSDQAELFETKLWIDLGGKIKDAAAAGYDRLATYSKQRYEQLKEQLNKHVEHPEDTLYNWAWWQATLREESDEQIQRLKAAVHTAETMASDMLATAEKAKKIFQHREEILRLPEMIAYGDPKPIQSFVDTVLMDIDPELAKAIKHDPNFAVVLEIIADHDSALSYLAYVGLMFEAIPPNFYAYVAGKGGAYLMIEVIMLVLTALLSAGAAAAARITMLIGRFAATGAKAVVTSRRIKRAKAAIDAFVRILRDLSDAVDDLHNLGAKLISARSKGLVVRGRTKTTLQAKKSAIKRDKRCRRCGSTQHSTPRSHIGKIVYD